MELKDTTLLMRMQDGQENIITEDSLRSSWNEVIGKVTTQADQSLLGLPKQIIEIC